MVDSTKKTAHSNSFSRHRGSLRRVPSHSSSIKNNIVELKSLELLDGLFRECRHVGEKMVSKGLITPKDIKEAKSSKGSRVISIGLPACILPSPGGCCALQKLMPPVY